MRSNLKLQSVATKCWIIPLRFIPTPCVLFRDTRTTTHDEKRNLTLFMPNSFKSNTGRLDGCDVTEQVRKSPRTHVCSLVDCKDSWSVLNQIFTSSELTAERIRKVLRYKTTACRQCCVVLANLRETVCVQRFPSVGLSTPAHFSKAWRAFEIKYITPVNYASHHDDEHILTRLSSAKAICHFSEVNYSFLTWNPLELLHERHLNVTTSVTHRDVFTDAGCSQFVLWNSHIDRCYQEK